MDWEWVVMCPLLSICRPFFSFSSPAFSFVPCPLRCVFFFGRSVFMVPSIRFGSLQPSHNPSSRSSVRPSVLFSSLAFPSSFSPWSVPAFLRLQLGAILYQILCSRFCRCVPLHTIATTTPVLSSCRFPFFFSFLFISVPFLPVLATA